MNAVLEYFVGALINGCAYIYIWSKLLNKKFDFKNYKNYFYVLLMVIIMIGSYFLIDDMIKIVIITSVFMFFVKLLFNENLKICIITPVYSQIIMLISEFFFGIIVLGIFRVDSQFAVNNLFASIFSNLFISLISLLIVKFKFIKNIYKSILDRINKNKTSTLIIIMFLIMLSINILFGLTYYKVSMFNLMVINIIMIAIYTFIIFKMLEEKNNIIKLTSKYNITLDSLKEYEDILNKYKILNHENKNQLLTIRNMITSNDKKTSNYIDKLIDNRIKDDEQLMSEVSIIPQGGFKAVIYSKLLDIKENNINYLLNFDKKLSTVDLLELGDNMLLDVCNVINVLLDNAIDAAKECKDKSIGIQMYVEEKNLFVEISNTYNNVIDVDKMSNPGYTTKEKGHGYGLSLVKQIIDKNSRLENIKKCEGNMFVQILKIKM